MCIRGVWSELNWEARTSCQPKRGKPERGIYLLFLRRVSSEPGWNARWHAACSLTITVHLAFCSPFGASAGLYIPTLVGASLSRRWIVPLGRIARLPGPRTHCNPVPSGSDAIYNPSTLFYLRDCHGYPKTILFVPIRRDGCPSLEIAVTPHNGRARKCCPQMLLSCPLTNYHPFHTLSCPFTRPPNSRRWRPHL